MGFDPGELRQLLALKEEIAEMRKDRRSAFDVLTVMRLRRVAREMARSRTTAPSNDP